MKRISTLFLSFILVMTFLQIASAQDVTSFRNYLQSKYPSCYSSDGAGGWVINSSCTAIAQEDSLDIRNVFSNEYYDENPVVVEDLQYFTSLKYLNLSNNHLYSIAAFPPSLEKLILIKTSWTGPAEGPIITNLPATLLYFDCDSSFILTLPTLPAALKYLNCSYNKLPSLPALPANLDTIICSSQIEYQERYPYLSSLPTLPLSLKYLDCKQNALLSLPALPATLEYLDCSDQWTVLSFPGSSQKTLGSIPDLPASLENLNCSYNKLNSLPSLPVALRFLYCAHTRFNDPDYGGVNEGISSLPMLPGNLQVVDCSFDNISCLPHLPASLTNLYTTGDSVHCLPNSGSYTADPVLPVCNPTNNSNQCVSERAISGTFFYDNNSNGIHDVGENFKRNAQVTSNGGQIAFSNYSGYFELSGVLGANTINVVAPAGYISIPASSNYTFTTNDTIVYATYALQPVSSFDSIAVLVVPLNTARDGSQQVYRINYENVGTTAINSSMQFRFDQQLMSYLNSTATGASINNNIVNIPAISLNPGDAGSFLISFLVSGFLGDTIHVNIQANANSKISMDSTYSVIRGSYDPNDKSATPKLTIAQVMSGAFINYTIRFQNTGTDTAFHVVVTDVLNSMLDQNSFQVLQSSHNCKSTRIGNSLSFEFNNILLPDSNINELGSHGFIHFRVKPIASVAANTVIPNDANIYFDYNTPVLTNTANTVIELNALPVKLLSFKAILGEGNYVTLYWNTTEEFNVSKFEVEESKNGRDFSHMGNVLSLGQGNHSYSFKTLLSADIVFYRLKIVDVDGNYKYSEVIKVAKANQTGIVILSCTKGALNIIAGHLPSNNAVITNSIGQVVKKIILVEGYQTINISSLPAGDYYLRTTGLTKRFLTVQ